VFILKIEETLCCSVIDPVLITWRSRCDRHSCRRWPNDWLLSNYITL